MVASCCSQHEAGKLFEAPLGECDGLGGVDLWGKGLGDDDCGIDAPGSGIADGLEVTPSYRRKPPTDGSNGGTEIRHDVAGQILEAGCPEGGSPYKTSEANAAMGYSGYTGEPYIAAGTGM